MKKLKLMIALGLIFSTFNCAGVYHAHSGFLPVSTKNRDATVVVIFKDIIEVKATEDQEKIFKILEDIISQGNYKGLPVGDAKIKIFKKKDHFTIVVTGHGSGVVLKQDEKNAFILTNHHVVSDDKGNNWPFICVAKEMFENCVPALVVAKDKDYDLAVIAVDSNEIKFEDTVKIATGEEFYQPGRKIYNWGFPIWYKKTVGWGYLSTPSSPEKYFGKGDRLLGQLPDGPGTSGSGIFDAKTHKLIGLMQGSANYNYFMIRYFIPSYYIEEFLKKNKIPFSK